jgi:hypothetical protein
VDMEVWRGMADSRDPGWRVFLSLGPTASGVIDSWGCGNGGAAPLPLGELIIALEDDVGRSMGVWDGDRNAGVVEGGG